MLNVVYAEHERTAGGFFQSLDSEIQSSALSQGETKEYGSGDTILPIGEVSGNLYILIEGIAKVARCRHGKCLTLSVLQSGDMFGELSMINGLPTSADVIAMEQCKVLSISRDGVFSMLQTSPSFMSLFLETLSHRTRQVIENVCSMALEDVYGRLCRTLRMLAVKEGARRMVKGVTHAELAEMVGASREMITMIMKELKQGDYIRVDGRVITLLKTFPERR